MIFEIFIFSLFFILAGCLYYYLGIHISFPPALKKSSCKFEETPLLNYVFLFVLDGARYDTLMDITKAPFINDLAGRGMVFHNNYVNFPVSTQQGIISFLTGARPGLCTWSSNNRGRFSLDSLISLCKEKGIFTSFCVNRKWWGEFFGGDRVREIEGADIKNTCLITGEVLKTIELLPEHNKAFITVHLEIGDHSGHFYGAKSPEYISSLLLYDSMIKECCRALMDKGIMDKSLFIITGDHGHRDGGGHGGDEETVIHTPLIFYGKGVRCGECRDITNINDIAPTVSFLLGERLPDYSEGRVLFDVIEEKEVNDKLIAKYEFLQAERDLRQFYKNHSGKENTLTDFQASLDSAYEKYEMKDWKNSISASQILAKKVKKLKGTADKEKIFRERLLRLIFSLFFFSLIFFVFRDYIKTFITLSAAVGAGFAIFTLFYTGLKVYSKEWTFSSLPSCYKKSIIFFFFLFFLEFTLLFFIHKCTFTFIFLKVLITGYHFKALLYLLAFTPYFVMAGPARWPHYYPLNPSFALFSFLSLAFIFLLHPLVLTLIFIIFSLKFIYDYAKNLFREKKYVSTGEYGRDKTGEKTFKFPLDISLDSSENLYVTDSFNSSIYKFDREGTFIFKIGERGDKEGQFNLPFGICNDSHDNIYVSDTFNHRIQKFDPNGVFITEWGKEGTGEAEFKAPVGISVNLEGEIYIADSCNNRIQKFDSQGNFITQWGRTGSGEGEFNKIHGLATDREGFVYVVDRCNHRIQKFSSEGKFVTQFGGKWGKGEGRFNYPACVSLDRHGSIYISDTRNNRIQKLDCNGRFLTLWGKHGQAGGEFSQPYGITVDKEENVYVTDLFNHRVQKFGLCK